jgi:hypothetical protein
MGKVRAYYSRASGTKRSVQLSRLASKVKRTIEATLRDLRRFGFDPRLTHDTYVNIVRHGGFNSATYAAAFVLCELALCHQPITVRGLMYRGQAAGLFPSTSDPFYEQTARVMLKLRRAGILPYSWIVDSTRRRLKPSSWSGLADFAETATQAYRLDFWSRQKSYIEFFVEKDAMAGIIEPVTNEFDVHLNVIRGQVSETFVWNVAEEWKQITKPISAYYLGDHDPAGFAIEANLVKKLRAFTGKDFNWQRLAVSPYDFANAKLQGFPIKRTTGGWRDYLKIHGDRCVEVDALDPNVIRQRIRKAIEQHVDPHEWQKLQHVEELERQTLRETLVKIA